MFTFVQECIWIKSKKGTEYVSIDSLNVEIEIEKLEDLIYAKQNVVLMNHIGVGDDINFTVWGYPRYFRFQAFQIINMPEELTLQAKSFPLHWRNACTRKTSNTLRDEIALELEETLMIHKLI